MVLVILTKSENIANNLPEIPVKTVILQGAKYIS